MTQPTLTQRLQGLAATLLILLLVAGVPFLLIAIGAAPWKADLGELRTLLTSPDDGTLAMVVIAAVAWIAWAFVAVSVVLEVVSQVRGLPTPTLPGLGAPQRAVGQLVAVAALLFVAAPTVVAAFPAPPAHAAAAAPVLETPPSGGRRGFARPPRGCARPGRGRDPDQATVDHRLHGQARRQPVEDRRPPARRRHPVHRDRRAQQGRAQRATRLHRLRHGAEGAARRHRGARLTARPRSTS